MNKQSQQVNETSKKKRPTRRFFLFFLLSSGKILAKQTFLTSRRFPPRKLQLFLPLNQKLVKLIDYNNFSVLKLDFLDMFCENFPRRKKLFFVALCRRLSRWLKNSRKFLHSKSEKAHREKENRFSIRIFPTFLFCQKKAFPSPRTRDCFCFHFLAWTWMALEEIVGSFTGKFSWKVGKIWHLIFIKLLSLSHSLTFFLSQPTIKRGRCVKRDRSCLTKCK